MEAIVAFSLTTDPGFMAAHLFTIGIFPITKLCIMQRSNNEHGQTPSNRVPSNYRRGEISQVANTIEKQVGEV